jgi:predicted nuclease with TOPRIM domain
LLLGRKREEVGEDMDGVQVTVLVTAVTNSVLLAGCYYGLKADNAALGAKLDRAMLQERLDRQGENNTLHGLYAKLESNISELSHRIKKLESGRMNWPTPSRSWC